MKHQYYCANATGDITGFTEKTGAVSRFTISEYSGGTAAGWGSDGKAEGTEVIELVGFTGTITINEVVELLGYTKRSEVRAITTDNTYYINGTLQSYMPPLPDPATYIVLRDTATIGHADTIDYEEDAFKVWTRALDGAEVLEEYNKTPIYLVDDDGNILVDSNNVPLVM